MIQYRPLEVKDFSGGITDNINGQQNQYVICDNLLMTDTKGLVSRNGSSLYNETCYQIPSGAKRINSLIDFEDELLIQSEQNLYYIDSTPSWQTLVGTSSNPVFSSGDEDTMVSHTVLNKHLIVCNENYIKPRKIYKDDSGDLQVRTAGLPKLVSDPTVTPDLDESKNYIYYFHYFYEYKIGTVTHQDFGTTRLLEVTNSGDFSGVGHYNQITDIPVLSNGSDENYDTANIKVYIYRTEHDGTVAYKVGEVTNGTTTFEDTVTDSDLIGNTILYIEGGAYDNDEPPMCKYVTTANDIVWYANVKDGTEVYSNRVRQSIKFDPDSCPASFYFDVDDDITGIGAIGNYPIVFTKDRVYRLEGFIDFLGRGLINKKIISDTVGCISHNSIIQTQNQIYFAAKDGFYTSDGFTLVKLSEEFDDTYSVLVSTVDRQKKIYGSFDKINRRIWWSCHSELGSTENDSCFIYDMNFNGFTTASGGESFKPSSLLFNDTGLVRADSRGYLFQHSTSDYDDMKVEVLVTPSSWINTPIIYDYTACAMDCGTRSVRKWGSQVSVTLDNFANMSLQIGSSNDSSTNFVDLSEIRFRENILWGQNDTVWGTETIRWNTFDMIKEKRRMPRNNLRFTHKQIKMTNAFTITDRSDDANTCTVDNVAKTAVMDGYPTFEWTTHSVDYYIYFEDDNYTQGYLITDLTDGTITYLDPANNSVSGSSKKWEMKGYRKQEKFGLISYVLYYAFLSDTFKVFEGDGGNA